MNELSPLDGDRIERQAAHDKAMRAASLAAHKTYDEKQELARNAKPLVLGQLATIGEHTGILAKWETQFDSERDPELLTGYYLEGKPNGLSCAPCGIPNKFMRHEVTQ